jgi:hypothetical protein
MILTYYVLPYITANQPLTVVLQSQVKCRYDPLGGENPG